VPKLDPQRWQAVAPHLEKALDLSNADRAAWLASVHARDPLLAADLEALLNEHGALVKEGFLERALTTFPGTTAGQDSDSPTRQDGPRYTVGEEHARGGMGRILRATDTYLERTVAIKELLLENVRAEARFLREAKLTARLQHPSVVPVYDAGRWHASGKLFYSMKLVGGRPLSEVVEGMMSLRERVGLLSNVLAAAEAIAYAHSRRVIHRDLKPANVLVGEYGETLVVDWGLAKELSADESDDVDADAAVDDMESGSGQAGQMTAVGTVMGTPSFMAPEQARGIAVDQRADVYALGAMLYFVLSARTPYDGASAEVLQQVLSGPPPTLSQVEPAAPTDLCAIVDKAMARVAANRYANAAEFAADLRRFMNGQLVSAYRYSWRQRIGLWARRNRALAKASTIFLAAAVAGVTAFVLREQHLRRNAESARDRADRQTLALLEDRGRDELERGHPFRAGVYLTEAFRRLPNSLKHRVLVTEAVRAMDTVPWIFHEHQGPIRSLSFGHNGKRILTASLDGTARILDTDSGSVVRTFRAEGQLTCSSFSPDNRQVLTASMNGAMEIWNVETGQRVGVGRVPAGSISSCPFSPDGRNILITSQKGTARIWNTQNGSLVHIPDCEGGIAFGAYSPDGRRILLGLRARTVRVLEVSSGRLAYAVRGTRYGMPVASFSPDGRFILAGEDDLLRVRDAATGHVVHEMGGHGVANDGAWSASGEEILSAEYDGTVFFWDLKSGKSSRIYHDTTGGARRVSFARNGDFGVIVSWDGVVRLLTFGGVALAVDVPGQLMPKAIAFDPSGDRVVVGAEDGLVYPVLLGRASVVALCKGWGVIRLQYSPGGEQLAIAQGAGQVSVLELSTVKRWTFHAHALVWRVLWSPDALRLLTLPNGENLSPRLWDPWSGALLRELRTGGRWAYSAAFSPNGEIVATAGTDDRVDLWNAQTGDAQGQPLMGAGQSVAFSPDGKRMATGSSRIRIWDVASGTPILELEGHPKTRVGELAYDPTGTRLVSAGWDDHLAKIWDLSTGRLLVTLDGHTARLMNARFSPDARYVVTGALDSIARLWDGRTGDLLRTFQGPAHAIDFAPDGTKLATGIGKTVITWDITLDKRSPEELATYVAAKSPWKLVDGRLVLQALSPTPTSFPAAAP
jgi:WD40 repeat protein/tRNA A-37 threonylcarbamoyl transferase component Bud32